MKTLKVDRRSHTATFKICKNLGQLIVSLEKEGEKDNLYISQVTLNGKKMDSEDEALLDSLSLNEVDCIDLELCTIEEIIKNSILNLLSLIQNIQIKAILFAKEFRTENKIDEEKVKYVLIECRSFIFSLEEIFKAHVLQKFKIKHHFLWLEAEKELTNILQCILQGRKLATSDFIADLIEYDLVQALDQWDDVLEKELLDNSSFTKIFSLKNTKQNSDNGVDA
jgi:hypothetical protein